MTIDWAVTISPTMLRGCPAYYIDADEVLLEMASAALASRSERLPYFHCAPAVVVNCCFLFFAFKATLKLFTKRVSLSIF